MLCPSFPRSVIDSFTPQIITIFQNLSNSLFAPFMKAVMSSTNTLNFGSGSIFHHLTQCILQHNARWQTSPLGPKESGRDGLERLRHTSFKLNTPLGFDDAAKHTQNLLGKIEMPLPRPQVENQCYRYLVSFSCMVIESFHLQQGLPHSALRSSISSISGTPFNPIFELPFRNLWCSQGFPATNHRRHERNGTIARDVLRNQEKHSCASLLRPSPTLLHFLQ